MTLEDDVAQLRRQLNGEEIGPPVKPIYRGGETPQDWEAAWNLYWLARHNEAYGKWWNLLRRKDPPATSKERLEGEKRLTEDGLQIAYDMNHWIHPLLMRLGDQWNLDKTVPGTIGKSEKVVQRDDKYVGKTTGIEATSEERDLGWRYAEAPTDLCAVAAFQNYCWPKTALGSDKKPLPGQTGFSVSKALDQYPISQVYVSAKDGLAAYEFAERLFALISREKRRQAQQDCDAFKDVVPEIPQTGWAHGGPSIRMAGFPVEFWNLACARLDEGDAQEEERHSFAQHWLTLELVRPLIEPDKPLPDQPGYMPPVPLRPGDHWPGGQRDVREVALHWRAPDKEEKRKRRGD